MNGSWHVADSYVFMVDSRSLMRQLIPSSNFQKLRTWKTPEAISWEPFPVTLHMRMLEAQRSSAFFPKPVGSLACGLTNF